MVYRILPIFRRHLTLKILLVISISKVFVVVKVGLSESYLLEHLILTATVLYVKRKQNSKASLVKKPCEKKVTAHAIPS